MAQWHTRITSLLDIDFPILQAGMGDVAMAELVAAVSEAGGLGVIGALRLTPEELEAEIREVRARTSKPFGVDLVLPPPVGSRPGPPPGVTYHAADPALQQALIEVVHAHAVPVLVCAMSLPEGAAAAARARGSRVLAMVGAVRHARRAKERGADAVIATGWEAGGHTGAVAQGVLTRAVAAAIDIPVIAAGGIVDGRGIASALMLGADGVWMGTRFVATKEAKAHPRFKQRYRELGEEDTIISRAVSGKTVRVARNGFVRAWEGREIKPFPEQAYVIAELGGHQRSVREGEIENAPLAVGQGVVMVNDLPPAGELVQRLVREAEATLLAGARIPARGLA